MFTFMRSRLEDLQLELRKLRRTLEDQERDHEQRLRHSQRALQQDYQTQLTQKLGEQRIRYESQLELLSQIPTQAIARQLAEQPTIQSADSEPVSPQASVEAPQPAPAPVPAPNSPPIAINTPVPSSSYPSVRGLPHLLGQATHPNAAHREQAAKGLSNLLQECNRGSQAASAIAALIQLSQDPFPAVRRAAVTGMGYTTSSKVLPALRRSLRDPNMEVVRAANIALNRFRRPVSNHSPRQSTKRKTNS